MSRKRLPRGFRRNADESIVCKHRDLSCCPACAAAHEEIVDVYGAHFWIPDPAERAQFEDVDQEADAKRIAHAEQKRIADGIANIEARVRGNVRPEGYSPPERIVYTCRAPWSGPSGSGWHEHVCEMKLDRIESHGPQYKLVRCLKETGAPPTNARPAPCSMGIAWFAIPEYIASGQIVVLPVEPEHSLSEPSANAPHAMRPTYEACEESEMPPGVRFDIAPGFADRPVQIAFGGEASSAEHREGAPFKRVQTIPTGRTTFFKLGGADERERVAARAFDAANAKASATRGARRGKGTR